MNVYLTHAYSNSFIHSFIYPFTATYPVLCYTGNVTFCCMFCGPGNLEIEGGKVQGVMVTNYNNYMKHLTSPFQRKKSYCSKVIQVIWAPRPWRCAQKNCRGLWYIIHYAFGCFLKLLTFTFVLQLTLCIKTLFFTKENHGLRSGRTDLNLDLTALNSDNCQLRWNQQD